jgi:hypothetical protein
MLSTLWVGLAAGQRRWLSGLVAAAALGLSWEVSYQSRILHPDGPNMQFVALALLFALLGFYRKRPLGYLTWFGLGCIAAAAATATKYTSGFSLFMVLILAFGAMRNAGLSLRQAWARVAGFVAIFAATFLVLVPGAILEMDIFIRNLRFAQAIYAGGYGFQTVSAGWDYFSRIMVYLFQAAFSHSPLLALFFPMLALVGAYSLHRSKQRDDQWLLYSVLGVPLFYVLFLATNRALFVRNLLIVLPSLAIFAGFGFEWLYDRLSGRPLWRYALAAVFVIVAAYNVYWLGYTANTIQERHTDAYVERALAAIAAETDKQIYVTPVALKLIGNRELPANTTTQYSNTVDLVLFAFRGDTRDEEEAGWPVNWPGIAPQTFGPMEMNFDWYANWPGAERLVLATPDLAWQDSAPFARFQPGQPAQLDPQKLSGTLEVDGEQFYFEREDETRVFFLNSANPFVVAKLRPFLGQVIEISGRPHDQQRSLDWYIFSVNGDGILHANQLVDEYNTYRFLSNRELAQLDCLQSGLDSAVYQALLDGRYDLLDLTDEELQAAMTCSE